jgi:hypothetical protein
MNKFIQNLNNLKEKIDTLKLYNVFLTVLSLSFSALSVKLSLREPIVIGVGEHTSAVYENIEKAPPEGELRNFLEDALSARFNPNASNAALLSLTEQRARSVEQSKLEANKITQNVILNSFKKTSRDVFAVDADRVIRIGKLRSAVNFPLTVRIEKEPRSTSNPYGLILVETRELKKKGDRE